MKLLLDTHVLIWWLADPWRVPERVQDEIIQQASETFVSAASAWEIAVKTRTGKLAFDAAILDDFDNRSRALAFEPLPVTATHAVMGARLPGAHKDPFDRLIAGQAIFEGLTVVTADPAIASLGAKVMW
ncbi:MAG: type II toxin-antitoxin system VapC family toxin [Proteobacteria bacterium]|nr:type II toxin-antitoxin system VapC family toxin [Pseudomonadota bacterium]